MLNKEVCIQCINSFANTWGKWTEHDDVRWGSLGEVACPFINESISGYPKTKDYPPPGCHKMLEQAVAAGIVEKKDA